MMKIKFLGAAGTVTGSRTMVESEGKKFLFDCGLFQGPKAIREKNWQPIENARSISAIVLTHAHIDHSGLLPLFWKSGFRGPIYCSPATAELCKVLLPDAGKLQEEDASFANRTHHSSHDPALPLFTQKDAENCLELLNPVPYGTWNHLTPGLSFRLTRSAHILGSAFVEVLGNKGDHFTRLVFSGDVGNNRSLVLNEADSVSECDELVLESTYGDRTVDKSDTLSGLGAAIKKTIDRGGTLIIPAFSVGRTQELLYMIQKLREQNAIPDAPVYLDSPMSNKATKIYKDFEGELKKEVQGEGWGSVGSSFRFHAVESADDSMLLCMDTSPKIVISASGMLHGGRVLHHLKMKLPDEKSAVLFVGYQVPGTKGYLLKNRIGKIRLHHQLVDVEAEIITIDSLSAHADSNELIAWVSAFKKKPRRIFLNHGEPPALQALQYRLRTELGIEAIIPNEGEEFTLS